MGERTFTSEPESPREKWERLTAMADEDSCTWDLSPNDRAAIEWALGEIERLVLASLPGPGDPGPSVPFDFGAWLDHMASPDTEEDDND